MKKQEISGSQRSAAIYIRVSTHGKQEELSPDSQKKLSLEYAKAHNYSVSIDHIFLDSGISGRTAEKRPEFKRMIALAKSKAHPFDAILVWKFSRFARNQEESIVYKSMLQKEQVEVISISEPIIEGPFGNLMERIIEWMDEYYSIRLSGDVIRGMTEKAERGGYLSIPPFGYTRQKGQSLPAIHLSQAATVRHIFDLYLQGFGTVDIARNLNHANIPTRTGALWECRSVEYILTNPFYIGKVRWNRQDHNSHKIREKSEWIIRDAPHTPILSEETFYAVQKKIKETNSSIRRRCISASHHWLSGILCCSFCGKHLAYSPGKNKRTGKSYPYFQCYQYGKGQCKESHAISVPKAEEAFLTGLEKILQSDGYFYQKKKDVPQKTPSLLLLSDAYSSLSKKEIRARHAYLEGIDTLEEYKENKKKIEQERNEIQEKIKSLASVQLSEPDSVPLSIQKPEELPAELKKTNQSVQTPVISLPKELLADLKNPNQSEEQKSILVRSIIDQVIFDKKKNHMEFHLHLTQI